MKKVYNTPKANKVDYSFEEQLSAESYPISGYADPWRHRVCTWGDGVCSDIYNVMARGINNCEKQGIPGLLDPYEDCL